MEKLFICRSDGYVVKQDTMVDDRCRVNADTALPHGGRYSAKVNLATSTPVRIALPVNKTIPFLPPPPPPPPRNPSQSRSEASRVTAMKVYNLTLWARSSPPGVELSVLVLGGNVSATATATVAATTITTTSSSYEAANIGNVTLLSSWTMVSVKVSWDVHATRSWQATRDMKTNDVKRGAAVNRVGNELGGEIDIDIGTRKESESGSERSHLNRLGLGNSAASSPVELTFVSQLPCNCGGTVWLDDISLKEASDSYPVL